VVSKRDLLAGQAFHRRRLVAAFASGSTDDEADPARPGRSLLGGLVLVVALLGGVALADRLGPDPPPAWPQRGLVVSAETGAAYVITGDGGPDPHPVPNTLSAALILGSETEPVVLPQEVIDQRPLGPELGIPAAPAHLPPDSALIDSGWTACTADGAGVHVAVAGGADATASAELTTGGTTVVSGGRVFAILDTPAGATAHLVPSQPTRHGDQRDNLLAAIGLPPRVAAPTVDRAWVDLFPRGTPLTFETFGLREAGAPAAYLDLTRPFAGTRIGDLLIAPGEEHYLLADAGPVLLTPLQASVYRQVATPDRRLPRVLHVTAAPGGVQATLPGIEAWPTQASEQSPGALARPCALLDTGPGRAAAVRLVPGDAMSARDVAAGEREQSVAPGRGAYVRIGLPHDPESDDRDRVNAGQTGPEQTGPEQDVSEQTGPNDRRYLIDAAGRAHLLVGEDTPRLLGYADQSASVVPPAWVALFDCGTVLSREAALGRAPDPEEARNRALVTLPWVV